MTRGHRTRQARVMMVGDKWGRGVVGDVTMGRIVGRAVFAMAGASGCIMGSGPPPEGIVGVDGGGYRRSDLDACAELGSVTLRIVYPV